MGDIILVAMDISKSVFQLHCVDEQRAVIKKRKLYRDEVKQFFANMRPCTITMEACGGSHYWARELEKSGHTVKLIPGEFAKSFVIGNKSDAIDAAALADAYCSPRVRFVGVNSMEQQDLQMKHRIRVRLIRSRTQIANELHGFLLEYGVVIPVGVKKIIANVHAALEQAGDKIGESGRATFLKLCEELKEIEVRISALDEEFKKMAEKHAVAKRLCSIPGIGPITATALIAAVSDPHAFKNGRQFAAWLGLVPRQDSTGGITRLGRITKRGDRYLRCLLVQGAHACMTAMRHYKSEDCPKRVTWQRELVSRRGWAKAVVACANKTARIAWAILSKDDVVYDANFKLAA